VPSFVHQSHNLIRNGRDARVVECTILVREHARAHLDDNGIRPGGNFVSNWI
jgi:hypothetical protein